MLSEEDDFNLRGNSSTATLSSLVSRNFSSEGSFLSSGETSDLDCKTPIFLNGNVSDFWLE